MATLKSSKWRQQFKVHPAADVFPMMQDGELGKLAENIQAHGLKTKIDVRRIGDSFEICEGRNCLQAMELAGIDLDPSRHFNEINPVDPVAHIISANIHRRHLTPSQLADIIVALAKIEVEKETGPSGPVSDDAELDEIPPRIEPANPAWAAAAKKNPVKEKALEIHELFPEEVRPSVRTTKRSLAKAAGKKPKPQVQRYTPRPMPKPRSGKPVLGLEAARHAYLDLCAGADVDIDAELGLITDALRELAGKRLKANGAQLVMAAGAESR